MKIRTILAVVAISLTSQVNAQWDTVNFYDGTNLKGIDFLDGNNGWVCGYNPSTDSGAYGIVGTTYDRGDTWNPRAYSRNIGLWDVVITDSSRVWVSGDSGLVFQIDEWNSVTVYERISPYSLRCGASPTNNIFFVAGERGVLFRTTDAGNTWDTLSANTNTTETINDIYFADAANGWIAGNDGLLKVTSDSGSTWSWVTTPLFAFWDFYSMAYQDSSGLNPYVVGQNGNALFSVDGGVNWYSYSTGTTENIQKIHFLNTLSGIMCGENGYIYRSEDGGGSWFADPSSETVDLFDIAFAGDTTAFICGDSGAVLRSRTDISTLNQYSTPTLGAKAYPNPTSGPLFVEVLLREESNVEIQLVNLTGQVLQTNYYENVSAGSQRFEVPASDYASGMYFIRVQVDGAVVTMPVIKE